MISSSLPQKSPKFWSFGLLKARRRVTAITYVEKWPQQRIEGHAAMTQRIQAKHGESATKTMAAMSAEQMKKPHEKSWKSEKHEKQNQEK